MLQFPEMAAKLHQVLNMFETSVILWRQIALKSPGKSPLVYTHDVMQLERDKNCIEKCDKSCIKDPMCNTGSYVNHGVNHSGL